MQPIFRKSFVFSVLLFATLIAVHRSNVRLPDRRPLPPATVAITFAELRDDEDWGPFTLAGHWAVSADDPRFAGLSSLAPGPLGLRAITDAGAVIDMPIPGKGSAARIADLPSGPGSPFKKSGRDSEAMASDPRGTWVGFENGHELRLFDRDFRRTLRVVSLRSLGWKRNRGVEGMLNDRKLRVFPEDGTSFVDVEGRVVHPIATSLERLGDVAVLPNGRWIAVTRATSPLGISSRLMIAEPGGERWSEMLRLPIGRLANPEGMAVQPLPDGRVRLWIVTDNDFRRRVPTELIALDVKP